MTAGANSLTDLRKWLRKSDAAKLVMSKEDEEPKPVALNRKLGPSKMWARAEQTIMAWGADRVEAQNASGETLDMFVISERERERDDAKTSGGGHDYKGLAAVIDRIAERHNEAFEKGSAAASATVESLVAMVDTLTSHLSLAITNVHNLSINLAHAIAGQEQQEQPTQNPMLERVLVAAATSMGAGVAQQPPKPNGKP